MAIERLVGHIPEHLLERSGKVFYSGRKAFSGECPIYLLGINPGGAPEQHATETVGRHTDAVRHAYPEDWSAYRDEIWKGRAPGSYGMAPRVLHLLRGLGLNPGAVPASNLVFVRSAREADIRSSEMNAMASACWAFHRAVIARVRPRVVLCFGVTAGSFVRQRLGAKDEVDRFVEQNNRRWTTRAFAGADGVRVVVATHPSIANWCAATADITPFVRDVLC